MTKRNSRVLALVILSTLFVTTAIFAADQSVTGTFKGNGKDAKLLYAVALPGEPFSGEETVMVVLTEKDPGDDKRPDFDAMFGKLGSALRLTFQRSGVLIGCEVAHTAHEQKPFSSIGNMKVSEFSIEGNKIKAKVSTGGQVETFDQTWEVDLSFNTEIKQ
ncbi:MAG: hypothetical protein ACRENZ_01920 [Thermodesulfobacteriota bacterium]